MSDPQQTSHEFRWGTAMANRNRLSLFVSGIVTGIVAIGAAIGLIPGSAAAADTASISGAVLSATNGKAIAGVSVELYQDVTIDIFGSPVTGPQFVTSTTSAADGSYSLSGLAAAGTDGYFVCFDTFGTSLSNYTSQCWADQPGFVPFPDPFGFVQLPPGTSGIQVADGAQVSGIDADLVNARQVNPRDAGTITGTVTQSSGGAALPGVVVTAFNANSRVFGQAVTGADGSYEIDNVPAVPVGYQVCFDAAPAHGASPPGSFQSRCYVTVGWAGAGAKPPASATRVRVRHGVTRSGVDGVLPS
jgi:hypothetical protein